MNENHDHPRRVDVHDGHVAARETPYVWNPDKRRARRGSVRDQTRTRQKTIVNVTVDRWHIQAQLRRNFDGEQVGTALTTVGPRIAGDLSRATRFTWAIP